jgi:DNA-binding HxlR family transcriptional regulator
MRHSRPRYDERIAKTLRENGELGFVAIMNASGITSSQATSRGLKRLRREGEVERTVIASYPPTVRYRLVDRTEMRPMD